MKLHRWVIEKAPKTLFDAAKFADELAILYKPLKSEKIGGAKQSEKFKWEVKLLAECEDANQGNQKFNASKKYFVPSAGGPHCGLSNHDCSQCRNLSPNQYKRCGRFNSGQQPRQQCNAA